MSNAPRRWLPLVHMAADTGAWAFSFIVMGVVRLYDQYSQPSLGALAVTGVLAIVVQVSLGLAGGLYRSRWRYGSFDEVTALGVTVLSTGLIVSVIVSFDPKMPTLMPMSSTLLTLVVSVAGRSVWRLWRVRTSNARKSEPVIVVGAGDEGEQAVRALQVNQDSKLRPVAFVDDDPAKSRLRIHGIPVRGTIDDLENVAHQYGATTILLAISKASQELRMKLASYDDFTLLTIRPLEDRFSQVKPGRFEPFSVEDLLDRPQVEIDTGLIADYVRGKRVMVTGAGGSIGSELCRQLAGFQVDRTIMLDRDESGLHATQLSITGSGLLDDPNLVLADIRDVDHLREIFTLHRPQVIFHAAALKHLALLEKFPDEAWKTNVVGTQNLLGLAKEFGIECFVNISTDKAAEPNNVLGWSKRLTERLTTATGIEANSTSNGAAHPPRFLSVRFGNVLGSRGSVLSTFEAQARKGGPLMVTDPNVTRYFMTVSEAVELSIFAGAIGKAGEVLILDMGEPVRIVDVARVFAHRVTPHLKIEFTGLRPGEKLHETLWASNELDHRPHHPLISHVQSPGLTWSECVDLYREHGTVFDPNTPGRTLAG